MERELERKQRDRQGRRQQYGEIEVKQTARFGKLCSPYQALTTPVSHVFDHSFPACSRTLISLFIPDQSTVAQRAETIVDECSLTSCG